MNAKPQVSRLMAVASLKGMPNRIDEEAPIGFEPMHKGFADLSLTTWVRRHQKPSYYICSSAADCADYAGMADGNSGRLFFSGFDMFP